MKRLIVYSLLVLFSASCFAQVTDSICMMEIEKLKKEIAVLKTANKQLKQTDKRLAAENKENLEKLTGQMTENSAAVMDLNTKLDTLQTTLDEHQQNADERFAANEKWMKSMMIILVIVFGGLFLLLLIFVLINRTKINKAYLKLEAKVDNVKKDLEVKGQQLQKTHEEDLAALKKELENLKK